MFMAAAAAPTAGVLASPQTAIKPAARTKCPRPYLDFLRFLACPLASCCAMFFASASERADPKWERSMPRVT